MSHRRWWRERREVQGEVLGRGLKRVRGYGSAEKDMR